MSAVKQPAAVALHPVRSADAGSALALLAEGFADDPTLAWCFAADEPGYAERLRGYLRVGHGWHAGQGHPVQGAWAGARLVGIAYVALPEPPAPWAPGDLEAELARACGDPGAARFARYTRAVEATRPDGRFVSLALLATAAGWRRRGVGSRLLAWTGALCDADPGCDGVVLDTASDANLRFYTARGYEEIGEARVGPLLQAILRRPREAAAHEAPPGPR